MLKKLFLIFCFNLLIILSAEVFTFAEEKPQFGIGIIVGEPTGLTLKYRNFPVVGLAWSFENYFHIHCDYWIYSGELKKPLNWYVGGGVKMMIYTEHGRKGSEDHSEVGFGLRVPFGLQFFIIADKLELFVEVAPGIQLWNKTAFDIDGGLGVRYYF